MDSLHDSFSNLFSWLRPQFPTPSTIDIVNGVQKQTLSQTVIVRHRYYVIFEAPIKSK